MPSRRPYARGRRAWGYDSRTGERVLLRDLVKDGQTGLPVQRSTFEPKHPQETPPDVFDPQVLRRPAPDLDRPPYEVSFPTGSWEALYETYRPLVVNFAMGNVIVEETVEEAIYESGVYESGVYQG